MHAVPGGPIFGTAFMFIFVKFFVSGLKKRNVLVSTKILWLMVTRKIILYFFCSSMAQLRWQILTEKPLQESAQTEAAGRN